jgi:hypothetical protein
MFEWETRKPIGVASIGKLDPRLSNVAASLAQRIGHGLDHPESLLANSEIDKQNPGGCRAHTGCSLSAATANLATKRETVNVGTR